MEDTSIPARWTTVIDSRRPLWSLPWRELWEYRGLIRLFVRRDFVSTYAQTVLGPLWYLVQPFLSTVVFTLVFSKIAGIPTSGIPPFLFYLSGIVCWGYFADCMVKTSTTFTANAHLFSKVYFPRLAVPIATVIMNLVGFGVQLLMFLFFCALFALWGAPIEMSWRVIVLPVLLLEMAMLGLGAGCLVSALTTRYRDLAMLVGFGTQLWMYTSCIVYPLAQIPEQWRGWFLLNPMCAIIEGFRFAFLGKGTVELWQIGIGMIVNLCVFLSGIVVFNKVDQSFVDTV